MPAKKASKKTAKKAAKKDSVFPPPPINFACLKACYDQHIACLKKGVDPALCTKRYMACILSCIKR